MTWLQEDPLYIVLTGTLLIGGFGGFGWVTGKGWLWGLAGLSLLAMVVLLLIERRTVTDREQLHRTLEEMVVCVRNNDVAGLAGFISPSRQDTLEQLNAEMPQYKFHGCSISRRDEPKFDQNASPPRAVMDFAAFVNVDARQSQYDYNGTVTRGVTLTFEKEADGKWRVIEYSHYEVGLL